jgi:hypothetical protein
MKELICNVVIIFSGIFILGNWSGLAGSYYSKKNYSFAPPYLAGLFAMVTPQFANTNLRIGSQAVAGRG